MTEGKGEGRKTFWVKKIKIKVNVVRKWIGRLGFECKGRDSQRVQ